MTLVGTQLICISMVYAPFFEMFTYKLFSSVRYCYSDVETGLNKIWCRIAYVMSLAVMHQTKVSPWLYFKVAVKNAHWAAFDLTTQRRVRYWRENSWENCGGKRRGGWYTPNGKPQDWMWLRIQRCRPLWGKHIGQLCMSLLQIFHHEVQLVFPLCWSGRQGRTGEICDTKIDVITNWLRAAFLFI